MSKNTSSKPVTPSKPLTSKPNEDLSEFAFGKENYILLLISVVVLVIGYALMAGGKESDPNVFNAEVFSSRRITVAPIVVLIGYAIGVYAIVKKAD